MIDLLLFLYMNLGLYYYNNKIGAKLKVKNINKLENLGPFLVRALGRCTPRLGLELGLIPCCGHIHIHITICCALKRYRFFFISSHIQLKSLTIERKCIKLIEIKFWYTVETRSLGQRILSALNNLCFSFFFFFFFNLMCCFFINFVSHSFHFFFFKSMCCFFIISVLRLFFSFRKNKQSRKKKLSTKKFKLLVSVTQ